MSAVIERHRKKTIPTREKLKPSEKDAKAKLADKKDPSKQPML